MRPGAIKVSRGRLAAIRRSAPKGAKTVSARSAYVAPGFIDLHLWGEPSAVSRQAARGGATAFLIALGPEPAKELVRKVAQQAAIQAMPAAECLGLHLEGPFLNPVRGGVLPKRSMRRATTAELSHLWRAARGLIKLITLAPELPGALSAIRWCRRHRVVASLGHSDADARQASRAVAAGASAVTHLFNGMRPLSHRDSALIDVALTDARLTAMIIADGVHVSPSALRLALRAKGPDRMALVTDSVRGTKSAWRLRRKRGAFFASDGTLAGSDLTMISAVRNAVRSGGASLEEAVRMASTAPARLLGLARERGRLAVGARADLVAFGSDFRVRFTMVRGRMVYQRTQR